MNILHIKEQILAEHREKLAGPLDEFRPSVQALQAAADKWWLKGAHVKLNKARRALRKARVKRPNLAFRNSGKPFYADLDGSGVQLWWRCRW